MVGSCFVWDDFLVQSVHTIIYVPRSQLEGVSNTGVDVTTPNTAQLRLRRSPRVRVLHPLASAFDWRVVVYVCFVVLAVAIALQAPAAVDIAVGSVGDRLFLQSSSGLGEIDQATWYGDEISADATSGRSRWTRQVAQVVVPAFDQGVDVSIMVRMAGWPADVQQTRTVQPRVDVAVNGEALAVFTPTTTFDDYYIVLPAAQNTNDSIAITMRVSDVFTATTTHADVRPKGVRVERVAVATPNDWVALNLPQYAIVGWGVLFALLIYIIAIMYIRHVAPALVVSLVVVAVTIMAMAFQRIYVVALLPYLVVLCVLWSLWLLRRDIGHAWHVMHGAFVRGAGLGCGMWLAVACVIAYYLQKQPIPAFLPHPVWQFCVYVVVSWLILGIGIFYPFARPLEWMMTWWHKRSGIIAGVLGSVAVALAMYTVHAAPFIGHADYADNVVVARNLLQGRGWVVDYVTQFYQIYPSVTHPQETWPLLQPVWIACAFVFAGVNDAAARIPNYLFFALMLWLIWRVAVRIWDGRVGTVAVALVSVNLFVYRQLEYATTDLAFVVFALAATSAVYEIRAATHTNQVFARWYESRVFKVILAGLATGLMLLQKPGSGGVLAFGMGIWLLYDYRAALAQPLITTRLDRLRNNIRALWGRVWPVLVWTVIALLCVAPYVEHNMRLYGSPAHTTEQVDAWLLEYTQWDAIYRVYAPDGAIGTGDVPDRSWLLRWGFDGVSRKMYNQVVAVRNYLLPSFAALPAVLHPLGAAPDATGLLDELWLWCALCGLFIWYSPAQVMLKRLVIAMFIPYWMFMVTYWHANEPRYWVVLVPWMALLAAATLVALIDRARVWFGARLLAPVVVGVVLCISVSVVGTWQTIQQRQRVDAQLVAADRDMYDYLRQKTPLSAVAMTRVPWQLQWYAERPAVMIPADADAQTLLRIAKHYQVRYLVLDSLQRPNGATRSMIDRMLNDDTYGFVEVYRTPMYTVEDEGKSFTMQSVVYEFPVDYAGVATIR